MHRLIISFYDNFGAAHAAVKELVDKGFRQNSISLVAPQAVCDRIWQGDRNKSWFFSSQPSAFQLAGIGPALVSGFLANDLFTPDCRPRSLVRALEKHLIPEIDAHIYAEGVRRNGVLVVVRADSTTTSKVLTTLDRYCPVDIECLSDQWRKRGWSRFDETAQPLRTGRVSWPNCITSMPGDDLLNDGVPLNWPRSIVSKK